MYNSLLNSRVKFYEKNLHALLKSHRGYFLCLTCTTSECLGLI